MATQMVLCYGKACYPQRIKHPKNEMIKHKGKNYCRKCYDTEFGQSETHKLIIAMVRKIFDVGDYQTIPNVMERQIEKYIREYNFTEEGIFNTLCYIYFEYDLNELNIKYGLYPVVEEYEMHHNYSFQPHVKLKETETHKVTTKIRPSNKPVVKKIDELEL